MILPPAPNLRFTPTAWAKLIFLRDLGDTEVGGFGISAADDLLLVEEICLVRQVCSLASVAFADDAVANFFDAQVDRGRRPEQFGRIWIHTHPGSSPTPSSVDEETFARVFGQADWAVMFILAQGGDTYARLRFNTGPGGSLCIPVGVDYEQAFPATDHAAWLGEYVDCVEDQEDFLSFVEPAWPLLSNGGEQRVTDGPPWLEPWYEHSLWDDPFEQIAGGVDDHHTRPI